MTGSIAQVGLPGVTELFVLLVVLLLGFGVIGGLLLLVVLLVKPSGGDGEDGDG